MVCVCATLGAFGLQSALQGNLAQTLQSKLGVLIYHLADSAGCMLQLSCQTHCKFISCSHIAGWLRWSHVLRFSPKLFASSAELANVASELVLQGEYLKHDTSLTDADVKVTMTAADGASPWASVVTFHDQSITVRLSGLHLSYAGSLPHVVVKIMTRHFVGVLKASVWIGGTSVAHRVIVATITTPVTIRQSSQNLAANAPELAVSGFNLPLVLRGLLPEAT